MVKSLLIKNCGQLLTMRGNGLGIIKNGFVYCEDGKVVKVGKGRAPKADRTIDAEGKVVMPGLIDCHTHAVFAGSRANEFKLRADGKSYLDILKAGGGIHSTVNATRKASKAHLLTNTLKHLKDMRSYGITTVEIKSGYGLDLETEVKILEVARVAGKKQSINVLTTFLGAHTCPKGQKPRQYLKFVMNEVLPKVEADFVDIFCEKGAFTLRQSRKFLKKAKELGFKLKIHGEQINRLGACNMAAKLGAVSCDHCDRLSRGDIKKLAQTGTVAVLLPIVPLYTGEDKYADGRALIDAGVRVAISTDFNPGSAPSKNIFLAMSLACLEMGLTVEEALRGVTVNAALALDLSDRGVFAKGKRADIVIMDTTDYREIPCFVGENLVKKVFTGGEMHPK
ncbi:MAG: imidazolonepropionase [bacterium]|nr:imidazolonepropionase [bacterium]